MSPENIAEDGVGFKQNGRRLPDGRLTWAMEGVSNPPSSHIGARTGGHHQRYQGHSMVHLALAPENHAGYRLDARPWAPPRGALGY